VRARGRSQIIFSMSRNTSPKIRATTEDKTFPDRLLMRTGSPIIFGGSMFQIRQDDEKSCKRSEKFREDQDKYFCR